MSLKLQPIGPIPEQTVKVAKAAFPKGNTYVNYELRVTNYELGKASVLWICGIRNVNFNIEN